MSSRSQLAAVKKRAVTSSDDQKLWYSSFDGGIQWSNQQLMNEGFLSENGPSLAAFNDKLYAAWKGAFV